MPASDFSTFDPDFTPQQQEQCARIIDGVRRINAKTVRLGGSLEELTAAADRVEALLASLDTVTEKREMETYRFSFDLGRPNDVLPFNPATGRFNAIAPSLEMTVDGEKLIVQCRFSDCYESGPDTVHGGSVAAMFDQVLAYSVMLAGKTGPTLTLRVTFLKPTPVNEPLRFEGTVASIDGRKYATKAACYHGQEKVAEAEALILASYDLPIVGGTRA